ncbi:MAG: M23 family metallopeptidase [alpha proteobacterium HIMB114]|nr:MAG: M23 family metallopeptidase [alpha proteobacterium HIMB114]|tara:strand:+ start:346 stop:1617 length:1272 start_codon:yes stop_codon:yes gene_type:complete
MVQNLNKKNLKFFISGLIFLIISSFFFLNQNYYNKNKKTKNYSEFKDELINFHSLIKDKIQNQHNKKTIVIKKGQSLNSILSEAGASQKEIFNISKILRQYISLKKINTNQIFEVLTNKDNREIIRLTVNLDNINSLHIFKQDNKFVANKIEKILYKKTVLGEGLIKSSLFQAAQKENIEAEVVVDFARIFGFEIDFQRDIRKNDIFQIVYDKYVDDDGELQKNGKIIYAYMKNKGREIALYRFVDQKGIPGYYQTNGKSIEKALMKTPINGARLSSTYGMRKHPILGYNKMHRGTDFAAPKGTPIMASGSGIIEMAKWNGAYGKYIRIRHNSKYKTAYAHLNGYARGIKRGAKVRQGQIIGYVGSTGRSTGPHLHYEVLVNGKRINSQRLKLPSGRTLRGEDREKFEISRIKIDVMRSNLVN